MISILDAATRGLGLYSVSEAARYARMPSSTVRSWFFPEKSREPIRRGDIEDGEEKALTFLDFVEAIAVRSLRRDYGVSLKTIRQAIDFAQHHFRVDHIFARQDHKTLIDLQKKLHIILAGETNPIRLGGKDGGQVSFQECVEGYMLDLDFNEDRLAQVYTAFQFRDQRIIMNPAFRFGEPIIKENGYPANVLWRGVVTEGSFKRAAKLYDASIESVEAAYRYCNGELRMAA